MKILLCYAPADLSRARMLYRTLDSVRTADVWFDKKRLLSGEAVSSAVRHQATECDMLIVLLSQAGQVPGGFHRNIQVALDVVSKRRDRVQVVPLRLEDHAFQLPGGMFLAPPVDLFPQWDLGLSKVIQILVAAMRAVQADYPSRASRASDVGLGVAESRTTPVPAATEHTKTTLRVPSLVPGSRTQPSPLPSEGDGEASTAPAVASRPDAVPDAVRGTEPSAEPGLDGPVGTADAASHPGRGAVSRAKAGASATAANASAKVRPEAGRQATAAKRTPPGRPSPSQGRQGAGPALAGIAAAVSVGHERVPHSDSAIFDSNEVVQWPGRGWLSLMALVVALVGSLLGWVLVQL